MKKAKNPIKTFLRLLNYIFKKNKIVFVVIILCIIINTLGYITISLSLKTLVDRYITPLINESNPNFIPFIQALLVLAFIFITASIASFIYNYLMVTIAENTIKDIRNEMFKHMQTLSIRYFDQNTNGSIMSIYTNDTDTLRQTINQSLSQLFTSSLTIISSFISMIYLSPALSIFSFLVLILLIFIIKNIGKKSSKYFGAQQKGIADITGYIEERMNGQKVIKIFNHEEISKEEFNTLNEKLFSYSSKANKYSSLMGPIVGNIGNLQFVLTAIIGSLLLINKSSGITLGILISYLQFTKSFTQPILEISQQFNMIIMGIAGAERIFTLFDTKSELDDGSVSLVNIYFDNNGNIFETDKPTNHWAWKKDGRYIELKGEVRFNDMTFGYVKDKIILENLNLYAKPGQKLAFVGSTGAGKTTITNLINRFYDVNSGNITYDGININDIKKSDLRKSLGIVLQDTHLFTGTIMENIRYGRLNASDEDVYNAAKLAHADHFINMLPNKFNTIIDGSGEGLSQGQKQLLAIARAAIANPPVLILDEATSSIDTRTEKLVQTGMDNLMKGRTVFVIAHRLSTIRNSDAIIVLENGKIIERGNHDDLIMKKGTYYQLYTGDLELD